MSNDSLENFINKHRDEFDLLEPGDELWLGVVEKTKIQKQTSQTVKRKLIRVRYLRIASQIAAAIVIFVASYYFHDFRSNNEAKVVSAQQMPDNELYNTLIEAGHYYNSKIELEKEKLYSLTVGNSNLREDIQNELNELDMEFRRLKEDLNDNVDNEEIIAAMIQNYRLKLRILQDMMLQLQDNNTKTTDNETKRIEI